MEIIKKNDEKYEMKDGKGKIYELYLKFLNIENNPNEGDYIYMDRKLLTPNDEWYSDYYVFGKLDSIYGRKAEDLLEEEIINIQIDDKELVLKRLYG